MKGKDRIEPSIMIIIIYNDNDQHIWARWGTPYDGPYREAPSERGIFFRLQVYEKVGISLDEVYKKGREICHLGLWKGPKRANRWILWLYKSRKGPIFVTDSI